MLKFLTVSQYLYLLSRFFHFGILYLLRIARRLVREAWHWTVAELDLARCNRVLVPFCIANRSRRSPSLCSLQLAVGDDMLVYVGGLQRRLQIDFVGGEFASD